MKKRPEIALYDGIYSMQCLLFTVSENLSEWQNKSGIYVYTRLERYGGGCNVSGDDEYQLKIIYIGCTIDFSNIKYTIGSAVRACKPTHICFYQNSDADMKNIAQPMITHYQPLVMNDIKENTVQKVRNIQYC
ncbi:MAG: hypothetical protein ACJAUP_002907 [Cellvibrionaceae bacterium]|jgi:hypothetical protein